MFLCNLDGKLYSDENISKEIKLVSGVQGVNVIKEKTVEVCLNCYGLVNFKHKMDNQGRIVIPLNDKIKVYKISSSSFGVSDDVEHTDDNDKLVTNILKTMKKYEKGKCKK